MEERQSKKGYGVKVLLVVVVVLVIIFILKPGLEGYGIYRQVEKTNYSLEDYAANVHDLKLELSTTKSNLSLHSQMNGQLQQPFPSISPQLTACLGEKAILQADLASTEQLSDQKIFLLQQA